MKINKTLLTGLLALSFNPPVLAQSLSGAWLCGENARLEFISSTRLSFQGEAVTYQVQGSNILVEEDYGWQPYPYMFRNNLLLIQFPDGEVVQCAKASPTAKPAEQPGASVSGDNNATLQSQIAGVWWGYQGSTERKLGLCPGGYYHDYTESSYSGSSHDSLGNQTQAWGTASQQSHQGRWRIQGDANSGVIYVDTNNGKSFTIRYRQVDDPGCLEFNSSLLCRTSKSCD